MKELSIEQKAKAYDELFIKAKQIYNKENDVLIMHTIEDLFPEVKEPDGEKIRKALIEHFKFNVQQILYDFSNKDVLAWLEKQGKETGWKPSKEEMDVLYGLAYITNQYDERKEEVITRLYQDLKREFFKGSSYENMFPANTSTEDDVRRRSTIQVLEYARSLDAYNQYGKADIDKDIAWLERQGEHSNFISKIQVGDKVTRNEAGILVNLSQLKRVAKPMEKQGEKKPLGYVHHIDEDGYYTKEAILEPNPYTGTGFDYNGHHWGMCARDGGVEILMDGNITSRVFPDKNNIIEQKPADSYCQENCNGFQETGKCFADGECNAKREAEQKPTWSEEDEKNLRRAIRATKVVYPVAADWLKSLRPQNKWKPSDEQMGALWFYAEQNNYAGAVLTLLYNDLKKLKEE